MPRVELLQSASDTALAAASAHDFLQFVQQYRLQGDRCRVALSGGRIAKNFFSSITKEAIPSKAALDHVDFFWADERCVPPTHAESNYASAHELLLQPLAIPATSIHRIRGELPPDAAASQASAALIGVLKGTSASPGVLDLVILGMGEDGHVASLFPDGSKDPAPHPAPYRAVVAAKPPPNRITLSYSMISAAHSVWVLASGNGKSEALGRSLLSQQTPLGQVRMARPEIRIYSDIS